MFKVHTPTYLSDHSILSAQFNFPIPNKENRGISKICKEKQTRFQWDEKHKDIYVASYSNLALTTKIKQFALNQFQPSQLGVDSAVEEFNSIIFEAARLSLRPKLRATQKSQRKQKINGLTVTATCLKAD